LQAQQTKTGKTMTPETAEDILDKHGVKIYGAHKDRILSAMKEIASLAWDVSEGSMHTKIMGGPEDEYPDKTEFIKGLFPEKP